MPPSARSRLAVAGALAATLAAAACAPRAPAPVPLMPATITEDAPAIRAAVTAFLVGEARLDEQIDTLLASGADFVADGVVLANRPRLAGVPGPGTGSVDGLRFQVAGDYAWAVAGYRWVGENPDGEERGVATFVLQRHLAGWRIRHVHSSHVARWTR
jgi:SnoaL-like domain